MIRISYFVFFIGILFGICWLGRASDRWLQRYSYLNDLKNPSLPQFDGTDEYFLIVLVNARHPDYSSPFAYVWDLTCHYIIDHEPDTGHAWIVLAGKKGEKRWIFEGGHSVNCCAVMPQYAKKLVSLVCDDDEKNPVRSLFKTTEEGLFEYGSGNNNPSFAAAFPLTKEGFSKIMQVMKTYQFEHWGLRGPNCVQFAQSCLSSIGVDCSLYDTMEVPQTINICGIEAQLWSNPDYATFGVQTPDLLEKRLFEFIKTGKASCALHWYKNFKQMVKNDLLTTDEIPFYPKKLVSSINKDSMTIKCQDYIDPAKQEVVLLESSQ